MSTDTSLITFKAISTFTNDLAVVFGEKHRPLKLYAHLINKTTIAHDKPIQKHIEAFKLFAVTNREALTEKNISKLTRGTISYSSRVFIDIKKILKIADTETQNIIWKHLLTISALVDPTGKARQVLKEQTSNNTNGAGEADFLSEIIAKVENNVDPNANPMEAVSSIMKSGIFTDLVQGMGNGLEDGSLDLGKLMGTVQGMVTQLGDEAGEGGGGEAVNMINTMMGSLNAGAESQDPSQQIPDLAGMLGPMMESLNTASDSEQDPSQQLPNLAGMLGPMMGAMMGGMGGGSNNNNMPNIGNILQQTPRENSIEQNINSQLEKARETGEFSE